MEFIKFKIGDRVRVIRTRGPQEAKAGQIGTVRENSRSPWVHFDEPTGYKEGVPRLGIPDGYADVVVQDNLELVEPAAASTATIATGEALDRIGDRRGVRRVRGEPDFSYRQRIMLSADPAVDVGKSLELDLVAMQPAVKSATAPRRLFPSIPESLARKAHYEAEIARLQFERMSAAGTGTQVDVEAIRIALSDLRGLVQRDGEANKRHMAVVVDRIYQAIGEERA